MNWLYILIGLAVIIQVFLFVMGRRIRKREKEHNVLLKYNIDSRQKAWQLMADHSIPEEDRQQIKELYEAGED